MNRCSLQKGRNRREAVWILVITVSWVNSTFWLYSAGLWCHESTVLFNCSTLDYPICRSLGAHINRQMGDIRQHGCSHYKKQMLKPPRVPSIKQTPRSCCCIDVIVKTLTWCLAMGERHAENFRPLFPGSRKRSDLGRIRGLSLHWISFVFRSESVTYLSYCQDTFDSYCKKGCAGSGRPGMWVTARASVWVTLKVIIWVTVRTALWVM